MPFDDKKPFMIIYENGTSIIIQDGKKYTLSGVEIKEDNTNEPTTTQEQNTTNSSKKQSRSKK